VGGDKVEVLVGLSNSEGNSVAGEIVDDGFGRVGGPCEGAGEREKVLESEGKRVVERGKKRVKE